MNTDTYYLIDQSQMLKSQEETEQWEKLGKQATTSPSLGGVYLPI